MFSSNMGIGEAILAIFIVSLLAIILVLPSLYTCRAIYEQRRMQDLLLDRFAEEGRNRRAYERALNKEKQRPHLIQLFSPVRMTLKKDNFPHLQAENDDSSTISDKEQQDIETGSQTRRDESRKSSPDDSRKSLDFDTCIEIPAPGLNDSKELRLVPNVCTICLSYFQVGSDIVWSSNEACEHAFHLECAEEWILNQSDGTPCPCCRQEFVVDPDPADLDSETEEFDGSALQNNVAEELDKDLQNGPVDINAADAASSEDIERQEEAEDQP